MAHLTVQQLEMFASVGGNYPRLVDFLKAERDQVRKNLGMADKNSLIFRNQGDLARLDSLIDALETSGTALRKLKP